jgi:hypothetical protein
LGGGWHQWWGLAPDGVTAPSEFPGGTVYLLGQTNGLSKTVESQVQALGYKTVRIGGATRFLTAIDIAEALGNPGVIFEADGAELSGGRIGGPPESQLTAVGLTAESADQRSAQSGDQQLGQGCPLVQEGACTRIHGGGDGGIGAERRENNHPGVR